MRIQEVLEKTTGFFKEKGIPSARLDAEILLSHALKFERIQLYLKFDQPLAEEELNQCREAVRRRASGEPVAYITGAKGFFGYDFIVNNHVLIPRPETELIVETAKAWAEKQVHAQVMTVLDLGTGSGCIGLSILKEIPNTKLIAVDLSAEAIQVAEQNAKNLGILDRVTFLTGDAELLAEQVKNIANNSINIFVSNPPYIARNDNRVEEGVRKFEPNQALFAENDGLYFLKKWSEVFSKYLAENSICLMEMGLDQGQEMKNHFESLNIFREIQVIKDLSGLDRVIEGVKHG